MNAEKHEPEYDCPQRASATDKYQDWFVGLLQDGKRCARYYGATPDEARERAEAAVSSAQQLEAVRGLIAEWKKPVVVGNVSGREQDIVNLTRRRLAIDMERVIDGTPESGGAPPQTCPTCGGAKAGRQTVVGRPCGPNCTHAWHPCPDAFHVEAANE
jgi:hypothetical protein